MSFNLDDPTQYAGVTYSPALANDPGSIQSAILARLQAKQSSYPALAGVELAAFPDDPESWRTVNQIGTVLVRFEGGEFGDLIATDEVVQECKLKYRIGVLARGLGWSDAAGISPQGAYNMLWACLLILLGYEVPGARKIYAEHAEFIRRDREGGIWIYALDIIAPTLVVEQSDAETIPTFLEGIVNNTVDTSTDSVNTGDQP